MSPDQNQYGGLLGTSTSDFHVVSFKILSPFDPDQLCFWQKGTTPTRQSLVVESNYLYTVRRSGTS